MSRQYFHGTVTKDYETGAKDSDSAVQKSIISSSTALKASRAETCRSNAFEGIKKGRIHHAPRCCMNE